VRAPPLRTVIERRLLINYRVDPDLLARFLPAPFRPELVNGYGVAGICLIRLGRIRPAGIPAVAGLTLESAAHRVAVRWDGADGPVTGVYIPRRDTSSRLAALAGGRVFPGWQHLARFRADEDQGRFLIQADSRDGVVRIQAAGHLSGQIMPGSVFASLDRASRFFACAPVGYAATPARGVFDGVRLETEGWALHPVHLERVSSSFFDDQARFPPGTAVADSAFLISGLAATWRPQPQFRAAEAGPADPGRAGLGVRLLPE
jgi:hypothetical protein